MSMCAPTHQYFAWIIYHLIKTASSFFRVLLLPTLPNTSVVQVDSPSSFTCINFPSFYLFNSGRYSIPLLMNPTIFLSFILLFFTCVFLVHFPYNSKENIHFNRPVIYLSLCLLLIFVTPLTFTDSVSFNSTYAYCTILTSFQSPTFPLNGFHVSAYRLLSADCLVCGALLQAHIYSCCNWIFHAGFSSSVVMCYL